MAVILNDLFFPKTDAFTKSLLSAFSFSMAYILRPVGSLIFGLLGDWWGRKANIIITTFSMSASSFLFACMPTYSQIGLKASVGVILCRIFQGISSAVEVVGAKVYITESLKVPQSYFFSSLIAVSVYAGGLFALALCSFLLVIRPEDAWRYMFFLGSGIAVIGSIARTKLKESPAYREAKSKIKTNKEKKELVKKAIGHNKRNLSAYFLIEMLSPVLVFVTYFYAGDFLSRVFHYSPTQIIMHNTMISLVGFVATIITSYLTRYFFPIRMLKFSGFCLLLFLPFMPFIFESSSAVWQIFLVQALITALDFSVGAAIFARGFPVIGRYTALGVSFSVARAVGAVLTSYVCVLIGAKFGFFGVSVLLIFMTILYLAGLHLFVPCEEDKQIEEIWGNKPLLAPLSP